MNKKHYSYFARSSPRKLLYRTQTMCARMHFNHIELDIESQEKDGQVAQSKCKIRYGIINLDDMIRDLQHWETLLTSSFMQRPYEVLEKGSKFDQIQEVQQQNLTSAVSALLITTGQAR